MKYIILLLLIPCPAFANFNHQYKHPNIIIFRGDAEFNAEERLDIKEALIGWEQDLLWFSKTQIHLGIVFERAEKRNWDKDKIPTIYKADRGWKHKVGSSLCDDDLVCSNIKSGDVFIFGTGHIGLPLVVRHGVGHILLKSSKHSKNKYSVMFHTIGGLITDEDLEAIERAWK